MEKLCVKGDAKPLNQLVVFEWKQGKSNDVLYHEGMFCLHQKNLE